MVNKAVAVKLSNVLDFILPPERPTLAFYLHMRGQKQKSIIVRSRFWEWGLARREVDAGGTIRDNGHLYYQYLRPCLLPTK